MTQHNPLTADLDTLGGPLYKQRDTLRGMVEELRRLLAAQVSNDAHQAILRQVAELEQANEQLGTVNQQLATTNGELTTATEQLSATNQELTQRIEQADTAAREAEELRQQLAEQLGREQADLKEAMDAAETANSLLKEARQQADQVPGLQQHIAELTAELATANADLQKVYGMHPVQFALAILADDTEELFPMQSGHLRRLARWAGDLIDSDYLNDYRLRVGDAILGVETRTWVMQPRPEADRRIMLVHTMFKGNSGLTFTMENVNILPHERLAVEAIFEALALLASKLTDLEFLELVQAMAGDALGEGGFSLETIVRRVMAKGQDTNEGARSEPNSNQDEATS